MSSKDKASVRKRGIKELIGGIVVAGAGGLATMASYNIAKPGESYTVYTGIIALGVIYAFKGLYDIAFPSGFGKSNKNIDAAEITEESSKDDTVVEEDD